MRLDVDERREIETIESLQRAHISSRRISVTTDEAMGLGRAGERKAKVPAASSPAAARLLDEIAPRAIHPIENVQFRIGVHPEERVAPARIDLDPAFGTIVAIALPRTIGAFAPGRANTADEID